MRASKTPVFRRAFAADEGLLKLGNRYGALTPTLSILTGWSISAGMSRASEVGMIIRTLDEVTLDAVAAMKGADNPRFREIMVALVTHLHAFVREVRLTEVEFREAAAILEEMGKLTSDTHNETVLMAGSLGALSLVCLLNNSDGGATETSQSVLGPFWRLKSPQVANGGTIVRSDTPGDPLFVTARVVDRAGEPITEPKWTSGTPRLSALQEPGPGTS